jgi:diguanylate cyclase (GGDEF)-like protein
MAITSSAIYTIIGAAVLAILIILPTWPELKAAIIYPASLLAILTGVLFYHHRFHFPLAVAVFHMFFGVGLITTGIIGVGRPDMANGVSMIFILTSLHAFHFFNIRASLAIVALIDMCYTLVAGLHYHWPNWSSVLVLLLASCITAGVVVNLLVRRLHHLATTDKLTGAYNRHTWDAMFEHKLSFARRYGHPMALVIIDLDRFKMINDSYGHQEGDRILQQTAASIRQVLRSSDISARWGGDEFIILLHNCDMEQALGMEKRLKKSLRDTISFTSGIAEFRDDDSAETLLSRADRNLLENKERQKKQGIHLAGNRETTGMESRQQSGV